MANDFIFAGDIQLYPLLTISPERFLEGYNLDIEEFVERNKFREDAQSKNGKIPLKRDILYLSYSHAIRLFRQYFPELEVEWVVNPLTGGCIFEEVSRRGYFCKAFVHDGVRRSAPIYYGVLNTTGLSVAPDETEYDRSTGKPKEGKYIGNEALFNKSVYRALVKAIAFTTGIGLKLWTGQDLSEDIIDEKAGKINSIEGLARRYEALTGKPYELPLLDYSVPAAKLNEYGRALKALLRGYEAEAEVSADAAAEPANVV